MYQELTEELKAKVKEITNTNYGELQLNDNAYSLIEDLIGVIEYEREEFEKYKERENEDVEF